LFYAEKHLISRCLAILVGKGTEPKARYFLYKSKEKPTHSSSVNSFISGGLEETQNKPALFYTTLSEKL